MSTQSIQMGDEHRLQEVVSPIKLPTKVLPHTAIRVSRPKPKTPKPNALWHHVAFRLSNEEMQRFNEIVRVHGSDKSKVFRLMLNDYYRAFKEQMKGVE